MKRLAILGSAALLIIFTITTYLAIEGSKLFSGGHSVLNPRVVLNAMHKDPQLFLDNQEVFNNLLRDPQIVVNELDENEDIEVIYNGHGLAFIPELHIDSEGFSFMDNTGVTLENQHHQSLSTTPEGVNFGVNYNHRTITTIDADSANQLINYINTSLVEDIPLMPEHVDINCAAIDSTTFNFEPGKSPYASNLQQSIIMYNERNAEVRDLNSIYLEHEDDTFTLNSEGNDVAEFIMDGKAFNDLQGVCQ